MKMKNILLTAAITLVGVVAANAQSTITLSTNDLILGVRKAGASYSYLVDLGPLATFKTASSSFANSYTFSTTGIAADMASIFSDANWATNSAIQFSIFAYKTSNPTNTKGVYVTNSSATPFATDVTTTLVGNGMSNVFNAFQGSTSTANNPVGYKQDVTVSNSYASYMPGGSASNNLCYGNWGTAEGAINAPLYLNFLPNSGSSSTLAGTVSIDSTGAVNYTVVPEPSTYAMLGIGAIGMLGMLRRTRKA